MTSLYFKAIDLAGLMFRLCESGTTPFPIGVGRKGMPVESTKAVTYFSALEYAAPLPTIMRGDWAVLMV